MQSQMPHQSAYLGSGPRIQLTLMSLGVPQAASTGEEGVVLGKDLTDFAVKQRFLQPDL